MPTTCSGPTSGDPAETRIWGDYKTGQCKTIVSSSMVKPKIKVTTLTRHTKDTDNVVNQYMLI